MAADYGDSVVYYEEDYDFSGNGTFFLNETYYHSGPDEGIRKFAEAYGQVHGYFSLIVCLFGITANIINVIVLTRKNMASPTNTILTALGISDMISLFAYMMFVFYAYISVHSDHYTFNKSRHLINYAIFWPHVSFTFEIFSMWLTITLVVYQYISICHINLGPRICTISNSRWTILGVGIVSVIMCLPMYLHFQAKVAPKYVGDGWLLAESSIVSGTPGLKTFFLVFFAIGLKLTACVLLVVLSALLVRAVRLAADKRQKLMRQTSDDKRKDERTKTSKRITVMLVAIAITFVIVELPHGLLAMAVELIMSSTLMFSYICQKYLR